MLTNSAQTGSSSNAKLLWLVGHVAWAAFFTALTYAYSSGELEAMAVFVVLMIASWCLYPVIFVFAFFGQIVFGFLLGPDTVATKVAGLVILFLAWFLIAAAQWRVVRLVGRTIRRRRR